MNVMFMTEREGEDSVKVKNLAIKNTLGIHARPAGLFAQTASKFNAHIVVEKNGVTVDGKSIMEVMMLGAGQGSSITVKARGEDAELALDALEKLIEDKFGEE
jgi:phosphocarrier protein